MLAMLVRVGGGGRTEAGDTEGARDCHIDSQTVAATPDGMVTSPGRRPDVSPRIPSFSRTGLKKPS